jgi:hypothetical protein
VAGRSAVAAGDSPVRVGGIGSASRDTIGSGVGAGAVPECAGGAENMGMAVNAYWEVRAIWRRIRRRLIHATARP